MSQTGQITKAGAAISLHIGQRVRHRDHNGQRVTGTVEMLGLNEGALMATIALDAPIVIPAIGEFGETRLHGQYVPAHELSPFDDRDELIAELLQALHGLLDADWVDGDGYVRDISDCLMPELIDAARAAIARAAGVAA